MTTNETNVTNAECVIDANGSTWISVNGFSIRIHKQGVFVSVSAFERGEEMENPLQQFVLVNQ